MIKYGSCSFWCFPSKNLSGSASVLREEGLHSPHPGGRGWELEKRAEQALPAVCPREGPKGAEVGAHLITGPFRLTQSYVALLSSVLSSLLPPVPLFLGNADTSLTVGPLLLLQMPLPGPVVPGAHWPIAWGLHPSLPELLTLGSPLGASAPAQHPSPSPSQEWYTTPWLGTFCCLQPRSQIPTLSSSSSCS